MADEILLTQEGSDKLAAELKELKTVKRPAIADAIREAKAHGDLRENAAYHEAKLNQQRNDGRINELEKVLLRAKIVERPDDADAAVAHLGSTVKLKDLGYDELMTIKLVGAFEADPANDKISISSPLGIAILGKAIGDEIEITAPGGIQKYQVLEVSG
ncbi:MAG: transcription elongation factor GreA [Armatimonadetes bacterium]|nr:transcription elongation factor GreA [Armatimonadota bacterium]